MMWRVRILVLLGLLAFLSAQPTDAQEDPSAEAEDPSAEAEEEDSDPSEPEGEPNKDDDDDEEDEKDALETNYVRKVQDVLIHGRCFDKELPPGEKHPMRVLVRETNWSQRLVYFAGFFLEYFNISLEPVSLEPEYSGLGMPGLLENLVDLDLEAPSYAPPATDYVEVLGGHAVDGTWPGIYVSPHLLQALKVLTPNDPASQARGNQDQWFSYYRALGSEAFISQMDKDGVAEICNSGLYRCYTPQWCWDCNHTCCRLMGVDPDLVDGINHTINLVEHYRLPYRVLFMSRLMAKDFILNWNKWERRYLLVTSNLLSVVDPPFRIQFPYRLITDSMSASPATKSYDWSNIRTWKVATREFAVLLNNQARRFLQNLGQYQEVFRQMEVQDDELRQLRDQVLAAFRGTPDAHLFEQMNASSESKLIACYVAMNFSHLLDQESCNASSGSNSTCQTLSAYCPSGSYFSISRDACRRCRIGYYCTDTNDTQQPCPEGSTTLAQGARSELECHCKPGMELVNSTVDTAGQLTSGPICSPCPKGLYKEETSNSVCRGVCPPQSSSDLGAVGITSCWCSKSYYLKNVKNWTCAPCPDGADCAGGLTGNVTESRLESWRAHMPPRSRSGMYGFFLETPDSEDGSFEPVFKQCPRQADCFPGNRCSHTTTGKQCRACKFNHIRDFNAGTGGTTPGSSCKECRASTTVISERVGLTVIQPMLLLVLLRMIAYANEDSAVLTPVIVKLVGLFFLATETCITAILSEEKLEDSDVVQQVSNALITVIAFGAKRITTDFTVMDAYLCSTFSLFDEADYSEKDLEDSMILNYFLRMMEILLTPVAWPCMALLTILPLGYLLRWLMGKKRMPDLEGKLSTLERMQILILQGDISLPFAQVIMEDTRNKLMLQNSIAGVWRPFNVAATARALAHEERPPGAKKLAALNWIRNNVSIFMPFWFFHYLNVAKNCMKAMFSCNRYQDGNVTQWIHGTEPMLQCFEGDHLWVSVLGGSGLLLYGLGFPAMVIWVVHRKVKKDEEWCWDFNVNGYTFWGLITVYWDCVLLLRSSFLSLVAALPPSTFQREKRIGLMMICAIALHLQAHVQPFDARRNNLLNTVEIRSLYTSTLVAPLLMATVEMQGQGFVWGPRLCLCMFILLIVRFLWTVAVEISLEARDAAVQFKKQTVFATMIKQKLEERQVARMKQQKQWLAKMLAGKSALAPTEDTRSAEEEATSLPEKSKSDAPKFLGAGHTRMVSGVMGYIKGLTESDNCDEEENDRWSEFSEDDGTMGGQAQGWNILRCLTKIAQRLETLINILGWSILLRGVSLVNRLLTKAYVISRRHEEMQNRYGVIYLERDQCFRFVSGPGVMGGVSGLKQKEEMVAVFSSFFLCILKLHRIQSLPIGLPRCFLRDVLHHAASDKRSLKWKAMTQKADKMLDTLVNAYINTRQDEEAYLGVNALEVKMHRWLSVDNPSGRLVRVRQLETFLLHAQFMSHQMMFQSLLIASMDQAKPSLEGRVVDYDNVTIVTNDEDDLHKRMRVGLAMAESSEEAIGHDMVLTEDVPSETCSSHLDDYWAISQRTQVDRDLHPYVFWDPLQDPNHKRAQLIENERVSDAHGYVMQTVPTSPCNSGLTQDLNEYESVNGSLKVITPWPCHGNKDLRHIILHCKYLDTRMRHTLCRLPEPMAVDLLRAIAWQMDTLRSLSSGLGSKVYTITKQVQDCRESALRLQKADKKFDGELTSAVLDTSEALVISVGMNNASELFQELNMRLSKSPQVPTWHKTHAQWFEAATMERSREFSARWTRWGVPVTTSEENKMLHDFHGDKQGRMSASDTHLQAPKIRQIHSWPMWQMMLRREMNMNRARGGHGLLDETSAANKGASALMESLQATPSGCVLTKEDWEGLAEHFKGARGRAFAKILVMFLEERRQIILDWCFSVATNFLQAWPTQVTRMGTPYTNRLENYAQGHALDSQFEVENDHEEMERRRVDLDKCRRVFGLGELGAVSGEIVWCSRGLHELAKLHGAHTMRETTCDLCDSKLGVARTGPKYACLLCNALFCSGCAHLTNFLCAGMDDLIARHPVDGNSNQVRGALDVMEARQPVDLLDELKRLEGKLNCAAGIESNTDMTCREVAEWARQRILSGNSILSMLLCTQGRHLFGFGANAPEGGHSCQICHKKLTKYSNDCVECCNCETYFCKRCTEQVQAADFLRAEVTTLWKESVIDDETRYALLEQVKTRPVLVLDVLYLLMNMKAEARKEEDGQAQNLSMMVHKTLRFANAGADALEEDEMIEMVDVPSSKDDRPFKSAIVGPNKDEGLKEKKENGQQCVLALSGMQPDAVAPASTARGPPAVIQQLVDVYTLVAQKRDELQSAREGTGRRPPPPKPVAGTGRPAPSGGDQEETGQHTSPDSSS